MAFNMYCQQCDDGGVADDVESRDALVALHVEQTGHAVAVFESSPPKELSFIDSTQNARLAALIRKQAREWQSSDVMDLAAWIEGSL